MRFAPALLALFLLSACVAIKDSRARDAILTNAQSACWNLPRDQVFEGAKAALESYRVHKLNIADAAKGYLETHENNEPEIPGMADRRHRVIVRLVTDEKAACTRVVVEAPIEEYSKKRGW